MKYTATDENEVLELKEDFKQDLRSYEEILKDDNIILVNKEPDVLNKVLDLSRMYNESIRKRIQEYEHRKEVREILKREGEIVTPAEWFDYEKILDKVLFTNPEVRDMVYK